MEVNGLVVAASEKIVMEQCVGLLLMLYNAEMDLHFCILICDDVLSVWKNICVNQCYKFSDLKVGMLQSSSGGKIFLLKTTAISTFSCMDCHQIERFHVEEKLKNLISVPGIDRSVSSSPLGSNLVSYQGFVTERKNSGVYELDSKVLLCTTFNASCLLLTEGSEIFVSNAHLIKDYMGAPILVCCGSSCVKNSNPNDISDTSSSVPNDPHFANLCIQYGLNVFDLLWFEKLLSRLKRKFSSLIADEDILFKQDSIFLKNVLEYFISDHENESISKKLSLVEEFLSSPHQCFPFLESICLFGTLIPDFLSFHIFSRLPTGCCVPYLSDILDEVIENASWIDAGPRWKFCIESRDNSVIVGILYVSTNRNLYIVDGTSKLPVTLTKDCYTCCHDQGIMEEFKNFGCASVVVVQEYDIIVEKISCKNGTQQFIRYLRTSFCRLYSLFRLSKSTQSNSFTLPNHSVEPEESVENDEKIFDVHGCSQQINHRFLVLSKIWTLQNKVLHYSHVLVLFLSENSQIVGDFSNESESNLEDTFNFYDSGDDAEFANLINKLNLLQIENKENKIGFLYLDTTTNWDCMIFPGHIYSVSAKDSSTNLTFDSGSCKIFTLTITSDMELAHDPVCAGNHSIEDYEGTECHGIKEILLKRQLNQNEIVTCVLEEKSYEDVENLNRGKSRNESAATLCMTVRDADSEESSIKVYVPHFSGNLHGLLPGASLQLFGFLCFGSQSGSLYLRTSSVFGILIKQPKTLTRKCRSEKISTSPNVPKKDLVSNPLQSGNAFHSPLQSLCFVVKIMSAEIFLACSQCGRAFRERCSCYSPQKVKVKLSALVDDGNQLLLAHCTDDTAMKILDINPAEWQALVSYIEISQQFLKFSDKAPWSKSALTPFINQVFNTYCSSKASSRLLMFEYTYIPRSHSNPLDVPYVWCRSAEDVNCQKHMRKHYLKLVNSDHYLYIEQ